MNVKIISVEYGESKWWLHFVAYIRPLDINRKYYFDFCGTELRSSCFTDKQTESLIGQLVEVFGWAPFEINKAKKALQSHSNFVV